MVVPPYNLIGYENNILLSTPTFKEGSEKFKEGSEKSKQTL